MMTLHVFICTQKVVETKYTRRDCLFKENHGSSLLGLEVASQFAYEFNLDSRYCLIAERRCYSSGRARRVLTLTPAEST